jgi:hypothetical protein
VSDISTLLQRSSVSGAVSALNNAQHALASGSISAGFAVAVTDDVEDALSPEERAKFYLRSRGGTYHAPQPSPVRSHSLCTL